MIPMKPHRTVYHRDREASLLAAKQAVKANRGSRLHRRDGFPGSEVFDVILGEEVLERHIFKKNDR